ncbi:MAG: PqqD family protein [Sphingomonadales bacterium]|nr:PqqD family protein [Sphingomonadales bacterium]
MIYRKTGDWLAARAGDEVMMMSAASGLYIGLNRVGARIWDLLDEQGDAAAICARLVEEFAVSEADCRAEVETFLGDLLKHKAVEQVAADQA